MVKKKSWFSGRTVLMILTFGLVGYVVYKNWGDILETLNHIQDANVLILLLLIPEQLYMYYACGQIFFSYLRGRKMMKKVSNSEMLRISTELNFMNHAMPAGGVSGLAFLTFRLAPYNITAGQASFLYIFRFIITTVINYLQAILAVIVLLIFHAIPEEAIWVIPVAILMNVFVFLVLALAIFIATSEKRIDFFARTMSKLLNGAARIFTFGRKKQMMRYDKISKYFLDIHESVKIAKNDKKLLKGPIFWGVVYSFFEVGTYWLVAIALGRPGLLPVIMVGEAIGSVFDGIVPYGLYELGMAGVMIALGTDFPTATLITVMTRVFILVLTIITGAIPYYKTMREEKK